MKSKTFPNLVKEISFKSRPEAMQIYAPGKDLTNTLSYYFHENPRTEGEEEMKSLDMPQQVWLQSLMTCKCTTEAHAKALHKAAVAACSMQYRSNDYDEFMAKIAKQIGLVGLEIRRTIDETKGNHIVGLVNTKGDEIAQLATTFTPHEIYFIKKMIERIIREPAKSFCLGSKDALEVGAKLKPSIMATKAEAICNRLVKHGWIRLSPLGRYSLTPRTLMELQNYLKSTFQKYMLSCSACEELVTNGSTCSNVECIVQVHRHCLPNWERSLRKNDDGNKECRECHEIWSTTPIGEGVLASQFETLRKERIRVRREKEDDDEEEDYDEAEESEDEFHDVGEGADENMIQEEEEEEEAVQEQPRRKRRGASRSTVANKRSRRVQQNEGNRDSSGVKEEDDDDDDDEEEDI